MTRPRRTITCARCGQERLHHARGLCDNCYRGAVQKGNLGDYQPVGRGAKKKPGTPDTRRLIVCQACGEERRHRARGLCDHCYAAARHAGELERWELKAPARRESPTPTHRLIVCAECGEHRPHQARGLCSTCYEIARRAGDLEQHALTPPQSRSDEEAAERDPGLAAFLRERRLRQIRRDRLATINTRRRAAA